MRDECASMTPSVRDLEWAAGFLEGEGSFCAYKGWERVSAPQVDLEPLVKLKKLFGGTIHYEDYSGKDAFRWVANGARARGLMLTLYSLLSERRQGQIEASLAERPMLLRTFLTEQQKVEIRRLHKEGTGYQKLSRQFNCHATTIARITQRSK